ncbi:MAG: hypothetical protein ACP5IO_00840 [Elusimicrobiales bacterium]
MKKYIVFGIIIVAAVIILLQIKSRKTPIIQQPETQTEELKIGKEIPKDYTTPPPVSTPPPSIEQTVSPEYMQMTGCTKTFEDIISGWGKEWGPPPRKITSPIQQLTLSPQQTNKIVELLKDYLLCEAIANKDPSKCDRFTPTKEECTKVYYEYQFNEFFIGANKNEADCKKYLEMEIRDEKENRIRTSDSWRFSSLNLSPDKICSEIKNDIRGICDRLFTNPSERKKCYTVFPKNILDGCPMPNKEECVKAYENIKTTGKYDCEFLEKGSEELCKIRKIGGVICREKLNKLLSTYCSYLADLEEKRKREEEKLKQAQEEEERKKLEGEIIKKAKQAAEEEKRFRRKRGGGDEE